jgi:hypothetical protein
MFHGRLIYKIRAGIAPPTRHAADRALRRGGAYNFYIFWIIIFIKDFIRNVFFNNICDKFLFC